MPAASGVVVEVNMGIQLLTRSVFMRSAADVGCVVEQIGDPADLTHQREELARADEIVDLLKGLA